MKKIWLKILDYVVSFFPDEYVMKKYKRAGAIFGDATSYSYFGECVEVKNLLNNWAFWEREFAWRGNRTISLDKFVEYGGWGKPLENFGEKRNDDEKPIFHAEIYRDQYLGKIKPAINLSAFLGNEMQVGEYTSPSTEK